MPVDEYEKRRELMQDVMRSKNLSKAQGSAIFVSDVYLPDMLFGAIARPPFPFCKITGIDRTEALASAGVEAVLTFKDLPGSRITGSGGVQDQQFLVDQYAFSLYDAVAIVAADSREHAEKAAVKVRISAEELTPAFTAEDALREHAGVLHGSSNVLCDYHYIRGSWEEASAACEVVDAEVSIAGVEHSYLETDCAVAAWGEDEKLHLYVGCHNVYKERRITASALGITEDKVIVHQPYTGGSFGGKDDNLFSVYAALLATATKRPVMMQASRVDEFVAHTKRHPQTNSISLAVQKDGSFAGIKMEILANGGSAAHVSDASFKFTSVNATGPYRMPTFDIHTKVAYTNDIAYGAMRSWDMAGLTFAEETAINMAAAKLHMDPLDIREKNGIIDGDLLLCGQPVPPGARYLECIRTMRNIPLRFGKYVSGPRFHYGVGYAGCFQGSNLHFGHADHSECRLIAFPNGVIRIEIASSDIGQGLEAVLSMIVSEALGYYPGDSIEFARPDTTMPPGGPTGASRQTSMSGNAVYKAAMNLIAELILHVAAFCHCSNSEVIYDSGCFLMPDGRSVTVKDVLRSLPEPLSVMGSFDAPPTSMPDSNGQGYPINQYSYGIHRAEVVVDSVTGVVKVLSLTAVHDAGKIINPTGAEGQIQGAMIQGLGMALMEEYQTKEGRPTQKGFSDYLIPTTTDAPYIDVRFIDIPASFGFIGAKGLGEVGITPTAPAIIAAIYDAVNVWITSLPATPQKVLCAISEHRSI